MSFRLRIKNYISNAKGNSGQALVALLFFAIIGITIITASALILYTNTAALSVGEQGVYAYYVAESGVEEALIRLIRNPSYTGGTLPVGSGTASIQVSGGIITSKGTYQNLVRKIQAVTITDQNGLRVTSWKEIN